MQAHCEKPGYLGPGPSVPLLADRLFWLALAAGAVGPVILLGALPGSSARPSSSLAVGQLLSLVLWQPVLEEVLFRSAIQGLLLETAWGCRSRWGVTRANLMTSLMFVICHSVHQPAPWAVAVFAPSLIFGFFRERYGGLLIPVFLHVAYNLSWFSWQ